MMTSNTPKEKCPSCGQSEIEASSPKTHYACGSKDYDGRPNTFERSELCKAELNSDQKGAGDSDSATRNHAEEVESADLLSVSIATLKTSESALKSQIQNVKSTDEYHNDGPLGKLLKSGVRDVEKALWEIQNVLSSLG